MTENTAAGARQMVKDMGSPDLNKCVDFELDRGGEWVEDSALHGAWGLKNAAGRIVLVAYTQQGDQYDDIEVDEAWMWRLLIANKQL